MPQALMSISTRPAVRPSSLTVRPYLDATTARINGCFRSLLVAVTAKHDKA